MDSSFLFCGLEISPGGEIAADNLIANSICFPSPGTSYLLLFKVQWLGNRGFIYVVHCSFSVRKANPVPFWLEVEGQLLTVFSLRIALIHAIPTPAEAGVFGLLFSQGEISLSFLPPLQTWLFY